MAVQKADERAGRRVGAGRGAHDQRREAAADAQRARGDGAGLVDARGRRRAEVARLERIARRALDELDGRKHRVDGGRPKNRQGDREAADGERGEEVARTRYGSVKVVEGALDDDSSDDDDFEDGASDDDGGDSSSSEEDDYVAAAAAAWSLILALLNHSALVCTSRRRDVARRSFGSTRVLERYR
mmetsp:Transcript_15830/g.49032  ORF Transcript_15830/g.49032 Transcript_15830/m.49032 type:complete len:186 (-) Transcript_15830:49-606(-)